MSNKHEIIEAAIAGGLIGAALGALLTGKGKYTIASALAGAAIGASIKAHKEAEKLDMPVLYEEEGSIYRIHPNGERKMVKKLKRHQVNVPSTFSLE